MAGYFCTPGHKEELERASGELQRSLLAGFNGAIDDINNDEAAGIRGPEEANEARRHMDMLIRAVS